MKRFLFISLFFISSLSAAQVTIHSGTQFTPNSTPLTFPSTAGSNGNVLQTNGSGTLSWVSPGAATMAIGSAITSGTSGASLYVNSSVQLAQTAAGAANSILTSNGTVPAFSTTPQIVRLGAGAAADGTASLLGSQTMTANTGADGLILTTPTAATSGNQMWSPRITLSGQAWDGTSQSLTQKWRIENQTLTTGGAANSELVFSSNSANGSATFNDGLRLGIVGGNAVTLGIGNSAATGAVRLYSSSGSTKYWQLQGNSANGSYVFNLPSSQGASGSVMVTTDASGTTEWQTKQHSTETTSATPAGTVSTTGVQMGIAASITTGASTSGVVLVWVSGAVTNNTASDGWKMQIRAGTGTAPTNGAALAGTAYGRITSASLGTGTNRATMPFGLTARISGLAASTAYWIDLSLAAVTGGTAAVTDVCIDASEQ